MTSFGLKIIAIISMVIDHLGDAWFGRTTGMNLIGRLSFPIFAFQISEGYIHTKNLKKYFLRLFIFALISQIPFMLFRSTFTTGFSLNIFFTLFFGLFTIFLYDKFTNTSFTFTKSKKIYIFFKYFFAICCFLLIGLLAEVAKFDYGFFGIFIIFLFYVFRNKKVFMYISFIIASIIRYGLMIYTNGYHYLYILLTIFTILPLLFINIYNGKQGRKVKYFIYAFYPIHLLILYFIFRT